MDNYISHEHRWANTVDDSETKPLDELRRPHPSQQQIDAEQTALLYATGAPTTYERFVRYVYINHDGSVALNLTGWANEFMAERRLETMSRDEFDWVLEAVQTSPQYAERAPELDQALRTLGFDCPICGRREPHDCEETIR